ncbi:phytoene/squalene synthase family protein [Saccharothrix sp. BKS2]|uniref:phytoene/squalene synthase family protein n=1 Tax=Saccharothrix sp. BKS2 TaxID=3064400 RepID=UPI0039E7CA8B
MRDSYSACAALLAEHDTTHYLAGLALADWKRPYSHALYGFARHADQLVDAWELSREARSDRFDRWHRQLDRDIAAGAGDDPVVHAVLHAFATWGIPENLLREFASAIRLDLEKTSFDTYEELERYMYGVASTLALQAVPVLQPLDRGTEPAARSLGLAFQLTNIIRDVAEDLRDGRVYLPAADLDRFSVARRDLAPGPTSPKVRELLAEQVARARGLYREARLGAESLHPSSRACWHAGLSLYAGLLDAVEAADYQVLDRRVRVGTGPRLRIGGPAYLRAVRDRRRQPPPFVPPA